MSGPPPLTWVGFLAAINTDRAIGVRWHAPESCQPLPVPHRAMQRLLINASDADVRGLPAARLVRDLVVPPSDMLGALTLAVEHGLLLVVAWRKTRASCRGGRPRTVLSPALRLTHAGGAALQDFLLHEGPFPPCPSP